MRTFEERYQDVLQNLELALVQVYREHEAMTDWEALNAINGLIRSYTAEERKRPSPQLNLSLLAQEAYYSVEAMCELRLGRAHLTDKEGNPFRPGAAMPPKSLSEIIACLKRIRKSIELWQKEGGRRGYFEFVNGFLP
jgi:hypothetical protein